MYELRELENEKLNKFTVTIVADENDGDYLTSINTYDKERFDEHIVGELVRLINVYGKEHKLEEYYRDDSFGYIDVPYGQYDGCHSLISVNVQYVDGEGVAWEVDLDVE